MCGDVTALGNAAHFWQSIMLQILSSEAVIFPSGTDLCSLGISYEIGRSSDPIWRLRKIRACEERHSAYKKFLTVFQIKVVLIIRLM